MDVIETKNLSKNYGKTRGIEDVNIIIKQGEVFGFIGPNGAGKSTTIRCIMNLINKNSGEVFVNGEEFLKDKYKMKEEIGYLPSEIHLYDDLTVEKMFKYSSSFYKKDCTKRMEELVKRLDIDMKKKIDELSLGNLKKVGIVLSLMHSPKTVIMDEATNGLDPLMQEVFYDIVKEEKKKGTTIFFSSHNLGEIKKICDRVCIIKEGKIVEVRDVKELVSSEFNVVNITSKDISKIEKQMNGNIIDKNNNTIKFINKDSINVLLSVIKDYDIEKLLIEEPSIEDIFMHYYK